MSRWEYCAIIGVWRETDQRYPQLRWPALWCFTAEGIQITEIKGDEATLLGQTIARLGEQGWEMVGCGETGHLGSNGGSISHFVYFKRQKP